MPWFKVDDNLAFHHKVMAAGNPAIGMWARSGSFSAQQLTDGFVPDHMIPSLGTRALALKLVTAGLWHQVEGGFQFHEWEDYQPTRAEVEKRRAEARDRMNRVRNGSRNVRANTTRTSDSVTPTPTRPDPTRAAAAASAAGGDGLTAEVRVFRDKLRAVPAFKDMSFEIDQERLDEIHQLVLLHGDGPLIDMALRTSFNPVPTFVSAFVKKWRAMAPPGTGLQLVEPERCPNCSLTLSACAKADLKRRPEDRCSQEAAS